MKHISFKFPNDEHPKVIKRTINNTNENTSVTITYENGFELTTYLDNNGAAHVDTNKPLINNGDGTFTVSE
jgi:hypothetical protein